MASDQTEDGTDGRAPQPRRARPTITDVARQAGVSTGTVSHVLNGSRDVSDVRRDRVMQAVASLGYVPNILAQSLRRHRSTIIGLCMPHSSFGYFVALSEAFEALAARDGYEIMHVFSRQDGATELHRIQTLLRYDIGGLLLLPSWQPKQTLDRLAQAAVPAVILDRPIDDSRFDQVMVDVRATMRRAVAELVALGHRRLLFITGNRDLLISRRRIEGMRLGLRDHAAAATLDILERSAREPEVVAEVIAAMRRAAPPTAILASNSQGVSWVAKALRGIGLRCPEDVSLIAVDEPVWAELVTPTLSVVRPPAQQVAQHAWDMLLARMQGLRQQPSRVSLQPELRLGGSVGPAPRE
jgi:LacI family transcriptional regulator